MASANVELVRSIYAAWERGDFASAEWAHADIEFVVVDGPAPAAFVGPAGMAEGMRGLLDTSEDYRVAAEEYRELDGERVLVLNRRSGRGKTSRLELGDLRAYGANLFHIRRDKVIRLAVYWDRERAVADLGLTPESH